MIREFHFNGTETNVPVRAPLLCWDLAHPLLPKRQQVAKDLETFAQLKTHYEWQVEMDLRPLLMNDLAVIVTDRAARILWVSGNFQDLTGYESGEVLGKSPALLQGPLTSPRTKKIIRQKLASVQAVAVRIKNYRKDRTPYLCHITILPLLNSLNECTHYMAIEREISEVNQ